MGQLTSSFKEAEANLCSKNTGRAENSTLQLPFGKTYFYSEGEKEARDELYKFACRILFALPLQQLGLDMDRMTWKPIPGVNEGNFGPKCGEVVGQATWNDYVMYLTQPFGVFALKPTSTPDVVWSYAGGHTKLRDPKQPGKSHQVAAPGVQCVFDSKTGALWTEFPALNSSLSAGAVVDAAAHPGDAKHLRTSEHQRTTLCSILKQYGKKGGEIFAGFGGCLRAGILVSHAEDMLMVNPHKKLLAEFAEKRGYMDTLKTMEVFGYGIAFKKDPIDGKDKKAAVDRYAEHADKSLGPYMFTIEFEQASVPAEVLERLRQELSCTS